MGELVMGELIELGSALPSASPAFSVGSAVACLIALALYAVLSADRENNDDDDSSPGGGLMQPVS